MIALIIIAALIVILALLRICVFAQYGDGGPRVKAKIGPFPVFLYPRPPKAKKLKKPAKQKSADEPVSKKPGRFREFTQMLPVIKKVLIKLKRKLLVKKLTLHYIASGSNAAAAALSFGAANAAVGVIMPVLENNFKIKKRDVRFSTDFEAGEPYIYISITVSIAIWEVVYILLCAAAVYSKQSKNNRKEEKVYGKASDK